MGEDEALPQMGPTGRDPYSPSEIHEESEEDDFEIPSDDSGL